MNSKILVGFLGGVLAATAVYYVQSHRGAKVQAEPAVTVAPAPAPAPVPIPVVEAAPAPPPVKQPVRKKIAAVVKQPIAPAPVEQAKVEAPPAPEPPPVVTPAPVPVEPPPPPPPVESHVDTHSEPPQPRSVTIANGTQLTVRLSETISTERNKPGDSFTATLDQPLVIDGLVIAEKGARATGRVVDALEAGRVKGLAHLSLELTSLLTSDGQKVDLRTARFQKDGESSKTGDAEKVGIGAAIGAAIGAIAGGGKGAAIGAASGGAAGGGVVAATRGKPAILPAETQISFRVEQPITITEKR